MIQRFSAVLASNQRTGASALQPSAPAPWKYSAPLRPHTSAPALALVLLRKMRIGKERFKFRWSYKQNHERGFLGGLLANILDGRKREKHRDGEEEVRKQSGDEIHHRIAPNFQFFLSYHHDSIIICFIFWIDDVLNFFSRATMQPDYKYLILFGFN